jgi:hypothetical protein
MINVTEVMTVTGYIVQERICSIWVSKKGGFQVMQKVGNLCNVTEVIYS